MCTIDKNRRKKCCSQRLNQELFKFRWEFFLPLNWFQFLFLVVSWFEKLKFQTVEKNRTNGGFAKSKIKKKRKMEESDSETDKDIEQLFFRDYGLRNWWARMTWMNDNKHNSITSILILFEIIFSHIYSQSIFNFVESFARIKSRGVLMPPWIHILGISIVL